MISAFERFALVSIVFLLTAAVVCGQDTVYLSVGDAFQDSINSHAAATTFVIRKGVHRLVDIWPNAHNVFIGEDSAVLCGARILADWHASGALWAHGGQTQEGHAYGQCENQLVACQYPEDLFVDNAPLIRVASLAQVAAGRWFFDYATDSVYMADNPAGHVVEIGVEPAAFSGPASFVAIRHLIIEKYAAPALDGAITTEYPGDNWTIENCEIRLNHAIGVQLRGRQGVVLNNYIHHNGQEGIGVVDGGDSTVIENNEISFNNSGLAFAIGWEAGGVKCAFGRNIVMRANYVHDNGGVGLWTDIGCVNTLFEKNRIEDNYAEGIFHEISDSAVIRCNVLRNNAVGLGSNLQLGNSSNTQVYGNVIEVRQGDGIIIVQNDRTDSARGLRWVTRNDRIAFNQIIYKTNKGRSGGYCAYDCDNYWRAGAVVFDHNTYHMADTTAQRWAWAGSALSWSQMRALGFEANGIVSSDTLSLDSVAGCMDLADVRGPLARGAATVRVPAHAAYVASAHSLQVFLPAAARRGARLSLYDFGGRLVRNISLPLSERAPIIVDARQLSAGTYCILAQSAARVVSMPVAVVR